MRAKLLKENNEAPAGEPAACPWDQVNSGFGLQREVRAKSRVRREMEPRVERQWQGKAEEPEENLGTGTALRGLGDRVTSLHTSAGLGR